MTTQSPADTNRAPHAVLARLARARALSFQAHWIEPDGSPGSGTGGGPVRCRRTSGDTLVVEEGGTWSPRTGVHLRFRGGYRWRVEDGALALEHLRRGEEQPTPLGRLEPGDAGRWATVAPHLCGNDRYEAWLDLEDGRAVVRWEARGPKKHYTLVVTYELGGAQES